jgi:tRNA uridine 5-carboxymethylaminomethyl modification enzyme
LREDNADLRLRKIGHALGLVAAEEFDRYMLKQEAIAGQLEIMKTSKLLLSEGDPDFLNEFGLTGIQNAVTYEHLLKRPDITYTELVRLDPSLATVAAEVKEQVEIQVKYKGYIDRQLEQVKRMARMESARIPAGFDYLAITGITAEVREKLARFQPGTLGQASRIPGVTPAAIAVLSITLKAKIEE